MDVLLVPTVPRPYTLAEIDSEPIRRNTRLGAYTNFVNLLDLSAVAIPAGFRKDGVPWGITFIAPAWREADLLVLGGKAAPTAGETKEEAPVGSHGRQPGRSEPTPLATTDGRAATGMIRLAVVGAHLTGLPLNAQITERGGRLAWSGSTAPRYRLYALPDTAPPKPGMVRASADGAAVAVEVWEMPLDAFGALVAAVPRPLAIGSVELATGEWVKGFLCEAHAVQTARDITSFGGWRAYLASVGPA
jgi:allophanate hydrolase